MSYNEKVADAVKMEIEELSYLQEMRNSARKMELEIDNTDSVFTMTNKEIQFITEKSMDVIAEQLVSNLWSLYTEYCNIRGIDMESDEEAEGERVQAIKLWEDVIDTSGLCIPHCIDVNFPVDFLKDLHANYIARIFDSGETAMDGYTKVWELQ